MLDSVNSSRTDIDCPKLTNRYTIVLLAVNLFFIVLAIQKSFSQYPDAAVKAELVFRFPVYVQWPAGTMNAKSDLFECCVLGNGRLAERLEQFDGDKVMEKTIRVKRLPDISALEDCHMLFIGSSEKNNLPAVFEAIRGKSVLTVGDMKGFAQKGGVINFIMKKDSVGFEINREAGKRAGLKISSKLLRLAKIVGDKK